MKNRVIRQLLGNDMDRFRACMTDAKSFFGKHGQIWLMYRDIYIYIYIQRNISSISWTRNQLCGNSLELYCNCIADGIRFHMRCKKKPVPQIPMCTTGTPNDVEVEENSCPRAFWFCRSVVQIRIWHIQTWFPWTAKCLKVLETVLRWNWSVSV
jgi:hypothetical protein